MELTKDKLRAEMSKSRDLLATKKRDELNQKIFESLLSRPKFIESKIVAFYLTKGSEVETRQMILKSKEMGKEVLVPSTNNEIQFHKFSSFDELETGKYGILEPKNKKEASDFPEVIIVPGLVFGLCMHRIGYGKGYYDRYLATSAAYRIGVCYDFQVIEKLPSHADDQRMDEIITDKRVII